MAEILVKAVSVTHQDPVKDERGCYKRGYPVVVMDDGHPWGLEERLPKFVVIKVPQITKDKVMKYINQWMDNTDPDKPVTVRRRLWTVRWADLPLAARNKLASTGELVIKATASYLGPSDYTWAQVKQYWRNQQTGLDETEDLSVV